jgi:hypothetical protein
MPTILPVYVMKTKLKMVNNIIENPVWDFENFQFESCFRVVSTLEGSARTLYL